MLPEFPKVVFAQSVLDLIRRESIRFHSTDARYALETGGIMIGKRISAGRIAVVGATGPGPRAYHARIEFNPDVDHANAELQRWIDRDPAVDFIGIWHKHPSQLEHPSGGDVESAYALFRDPSYKMVELVNPIVTVRESGLRMNCFYMSREDAAQRRGFRVIEYDVQPDDAAVFSREASGRARLRSEFSQLRERYKLQTSVDGADLILTAALGDSAKTTVYLVCSAEYPQQAPQLIIEHSGQELAFTSDVVKGWSPRRYLVDVIAEVERSIEDGRLP